MRSITGPSARTRRPRTPSPATVPVRAGRQPCTVATASTMVKASTTSTSEARNVAEMAGAAVAHEIMAVAFVSQAAQQDEIFLRDRGMIDTRYSVQYDCNDRNIQ